MVTVADSGIGVPPAEIPRLFERFHRIENVRARSNEGSGIGLALVKELVDLHGGSITADSVEGAGTTFTIRLPFGAAHLPADRVAPADASAGRRRRSPRRIVQEALRWMPAEVVDDADGSPDGRRARAGRAGFRLAGRRRGCSSPTTTPTCATTWSDCCVSDGYEVDAVTDGQQALDAVRAACRTWWSAT